MKTHKHVKLPDALGPVKQPFVTFIELWCAAAVVRSGGQHVAEDFSSWISGDSQHRFLASIRADESRTEG
jgi:hypothetical protein